MKLVECQTWTVCPPPPLRMGGAYWSFLRLTSDDGIEGVGECYGSALPPPLHEALVAELFAKHFADRDPHRITQFFREVFARGYTSRPDLTMMSAFSGLEMACWDIIAKAADCPVYDFLGGTVHETLRGYTYLYPDEQEDAAAFYASPERAAAKAQDYQAQGFSAVKFDPVGAYSVYDPHTPSKERMDKAIAMVAAVREAVGSQCDLLIGTHGQFSLAGAKRFGKLLEPYDPLWFEEPMPPEGDAAWRDLAGSFSVPIASGERLATRYEFARLLDTGAVQIVQPDSAQVGGVYEMRAVASLAEVRHAQLAPHLYCGPVAGAANIQVAAASANFLILEGLESWGGFSAEVLTQKIGFQDGRVLVPDAPGLGVELNIPVLEKHLWSAGTGKQAASPPHLHLNPTDKPLA